MMYKLLGTPNEKIWPGFDTLPKYGSYRISAAQAQPYNYLQTDFNRLSKKGVDLLNRLLTYDPRRRCTASQALEHELLPGASTAQTRRGDATFRRFTTCWRQSDQTRVQNRSNGDGADNNDDR